MPLTIGFGGASCVRKTLDNIGVAGSFDPVNRSFAEIADDALTLPLSEQLKLACTLLERAETSDDNGAEAAWEEEIGRRVALIDAGLAKGRPFNAVLLDIDRRFAK